MWRISPPSHGPPSLHQHLIRLSLEFKQLPLTPPHGSTIKEPVLSKTSSSWKRFLHKCTNEKANETPEGLRTNKPQECLWVLFSTTSTERPVCATWQASVPALSTYTEKKCKSSINKPLRSETILLWRMQAHSLRLPDEKQRQAYGMHTQSQARWTLLRLRRPSPDSPTPP